MNDQGRIFTAYHRLLLAIMLLWLGFNFLGTLLGLVVQIPDALWGAFGVLFFVVSGYFAFRHVVSRFILGPEDASD